MSNQTESGKCWIYKRATLVRDDGAQEIIDYTDGTEPFDCSKLMKDDMDHPVYVWKLAGERIHIPLNVKRNSVSSIYNSGTIETDRGMIEYEYIFGKFRTYTQVMMSQLSSCAPLIVIIAVLSFIAIRRRQE